MNKNCEEKRLLVLDSEGDEELEQLQQSSSHALLDDELQPEE